MKGSECDQCNLNNDIIFNRYYTKKASVRLIKQSKASAKSNIKMVTELGLSLLSYCCCFTTPTAKFLVGKTDIFLKKGTYNGYIKAR